MNYTLHQLKVFLKVVEHESITRASEDLFLTQPAVSIQLKKLQDQFTIPLTEVVGRKLYVTDFGKEIAVAAENILNQVEAINYKTIQYKNQLGGRLKISIASTGKYVMPYFLSDFMHSHKGVDLLMDVTNKSQVIKSLENNEVDFALVSMIPEQMNLNRIELLQNKLFLVGSPKVHARGTDVNSIFSEFPLLFRELGSSTRYSMEEFIKENAIPIVKKVELTSNEAVKQAVIAGLGYTIMPLIGIKNELKNGDLVIVDHPGLPLITQWNLIWLSAKKLSPVAEAFSSYLIDQKDRIVSERFSWYEDY
ncbi:MAG: LysR family transcriptional regulator [Flavobacteriales bacterium]|nr:LysR family transcriptional regulator [Flavobacteriales bacterium]